MLLEDKNIIETLPCGITIDHSKGEACYNVCQKWWIRYEEDVEFQNILIEACYNPQSPHRDRFSELEEEE